MFFKAFLTSSVVKESLFVAGWWIWRKLLIEAVRRRAIEWDDVLILGDGFVRQFLYGMPELASLLIEVASV